MALPQKLPLDLMQTSWATQLNPLVGCSLTKGFLLTDQKLINGTTVINHGLGRNLQGWIIVGIDAAATIYDNQATNQMKNLTLSLTSNAACTVALWVF